MDKNYSGVVMLKNAIFDIGGVLTVFDPNDYLAPFGIEADKAEALNMAIFQSPHWKDYMIGKVNKEQFKSFVCLENPDLKVEIQNILADENTHKLLPPLNEGIEFLKKCKRAGLRVFILSNIVEASLEYFNSSFKEVTDILDGGIYSCEVGMRKPDEKIYKYILEKYDIKPEETVFFDDSQRNVDAACKLGINGILCVPLKHEGVFKDLETRLGALGVDFKE